MSFLYKIMFTKKQNLRPMDKI